MSQNQRRTKDACPMTFADADKMFGKIVFSGTAYVVRARQDPDNHIHIVVHHLREGKENLPLAYLYGFNAIFTGNN